MGKSLLLVTINCIIQLGHAHRIFGGNIFCANGKNPPPPLSWNNSITEDTDTIAIDYWNHNAEGNCVADILLYTAPFSILTDLIFVVSFSVILHVSLRSCVSLSGFVYHLFLSICRSSPNDLSRSKVGLNFDNQQATTPEKLFVSLERCLFS